MASDDSLYQRIYKLETSLHKLEIRHDPEKLKKLLADNFTEIGSSGKVYTKAQIIKELAGEANINISVHDFQIKLLSPEIILAIYIAEISISYNKSTKQSRRSSIWKYDGQAWRMVFHQGTSI